MARGKKRRTFGGRKASSSSSDDVKLCFNLEEAEGLFTPEHTTHENKQVGGSWQRDGDLEKGKTALVQHICITTLGLNQMSF